MSETPAEIIERVREADVPLHEAVEALCHEAEAQQRANNDDLAERLWDVADKIEGAEKRLTELERLRIDEGYHHADGRFDVDDLGGRWGPTPAVLLTLKDGADEHE